MLLLMGIYLYAISHKTDVHYRDCRSIDYDNATHRLIANCTRFYTQFTKEASDNAIAVIDGIFVTERETLYRPVNFVPQCRLTVCPDNDPACLSIRLFNYTYSASGRGECQLLAEVCESHGNIGCRPSGGDCICQA